MDQSNRVLLISADSHASAFPETYRPYIEARYADRIDDLETEGVLYRAYTQTMSRFPEEALDIIDSEGAIRSGGAEGAFNVDRRLKEMDREGIAAEMVLPGAGHGTSLPFFSAGNEPYPADLRAAGARAYHRWLVDLMDQAGGRLMAVANPGPCLDMDQTIRDLRWVAEHGFRSVSVPGVVEDPDLPSLADPHFEPFWKACTDLGLVLSVHAGDRQPQGKWTKYFDQLAQMGDAESGRESVVDLMNAQGSPFDLDYVPAQVMWSFMLAGVFDRYPELQLVLTEVRADWLPATLAILDKRFADGATPLRKSPTEYWRSNCWAGTTSIKQSEVRLRHQIGVDRMMFGRDFPHPESTWPNTWDWLRDAFSGVPEDEVRAIVGENALACYAIDPTPMQAIADRIGPRIDDLLGDAHHVDPNIVDHFAQRAGYRKSYENIDVDVVSDLFEQDLAASSSR